MVGINTHITCILYHLIYACFCSSICIGNERIGVELINQWKASGHNSDPAGHSIDTGDTCHRSTFETVLVHGNPAAIDANRRYIDEDLNRQFLFATEEEAGTTGKASGRSMYMVLLISYAYICEF